jgi:hypothetical protein
MKFWDASAILPIRAADSLQLAAALMWSNGLANGHEFVCLDQRLGQAAHREGFKVLPSLQKDGSS